MIEEVLRAEFIKLRDDLIKEYDTLGMRASGRWASELEVLTDEDTGTLKGLDYTQQLQFGREGNNGLSGKKWEDAQGDIEKWIQDKGINYSGITLSSLAFLIARKIAREGWNRQGYGGVNLVERVVTPQRIQGIIDKVGQAYLSGFVKDLITELKVA